MRISCSDRFSGGLRCREVDRPRRDLRGHWPDDILRCINHRANSAKVAEGVEATARHADQENLWELVWRKRTIYFLFVFVTGYLLLYPVLRDSYAFQELRTPLRMVSDTIRLLGSVLPGLASRWIDAYARDPAWFLVWAFLVGFLTWISTRLAGSINDRMRILWTTYLPASNKRAEPRPPLVASHRTQSVIFVGVIAYLLLYPYLTQLTGWLRRLALPGIANDLLLANLVQPVPFVLVAFLVILFLASKAEGQKTSAMVGLSDNITRIQIQHFSCGIGGWACFIWPSRSAATTDSRAANSFAEFCTATPGMDATS